MKDIMEQEIQKKGYNNHKTESRSNGGREWNSIFSYRRRYEIILTRSNRRNSEGAER
jgi:hypothetical protein